jgi:hypothetical protein
MFMPLLQHLLEHGDLPGHRAEGADDPGLELVVRGRVRRQLLQVRVGEVLEDVLLLDVELAEVDVGAVGAGGSPQGAHTIHGDGIASKTVGWFSVAEPVRSRGAFEWRLGGFARKVDN